MASCCFDFGWIWFSVSSGGRPESMFSEKWRKSVTGFSMTFVLCFLCLDASNWLSGLWQWSSTSLLPGPIFCRTQVCRKVAHRRIGTVKHTVRESKDESNILLRASMADHHSTDSLTCLWYFEESIIMFRMSHIFKWAQSEFWLLSTSQHFAQNWGLLAVMTGVVSEKMMATKEGKLIRWFRDGFNCRDSLIQF